MKRPFCRKRGADILTSQYDYELQSVVLSGLNYSKLTKEEKEWSENIKLLLDKLSERKCFGIKNSGGLD